MHGTQHHDWHPEFLLADYEHRIYADDYECVYAIVDEDDYQFFSQWRWHTVANSTGKKLYLRRVTGRADHSTPIYLHVAIHKRRGIRKPSKFHTMVDHQNGDSLYCRKYNLRWATPKMNRRNRLGQAELDI